MKILMVDKYFFIKGGAERYFFELIEILKAHGHEVVPFSMKHPSNFTSLYQKFFVRHIDFDSNGLKQRIIVGFRSMGRVLYSFHAKRQIQKLIRCTRPDIAHLHMIDHQISPSILHALKKAKIPVVQTIHTYKHICASYRLYHMNNKMVCERCLGGKHYRALGQKCHKGSNFATLLLIVEMYVHRLLGFYSKYVDLFHVPSYFMGEKMIEAGIPRNKIKHLFYTIDVNQYPYSDDSKNYFLYFGRLSNEKGLMTLLKAMKGVSASQLRIAGKGPEENDLKAFVEKENLKNVAFLGGVYGDALKTLIANAQFVIVPSEWYENSPLVIYEAMTMGKPVIGSKMGGIPELVDHGQSGYLFEAGNHLELRFHILEMLRSSKRRKQMGKAAREKAIRLFHPERHYTDLMKIYESLQKHQNR